MRKGEPKADFEHDSTFCTRRTKKSTRPCRRCVIPFCDPLFGFFVGIGGQNPSLANDGIRGIARKTLKVVGATGFEPATPCAQRQKVQSEMSSEFDNSDAPLQQDLQPAAPKAPNGEPDGPALLSTCRAFAEGGRSPGRRGVARRVPTRPARPARRRGAPSRAMASRIRCRRRGAGNVRRRLSRRAKGGAPAAALSFG